MFEPKQSYGLNDAILHADHARPTSRRDLLRAGLVSGVGSVMAGSVFSLFANPRAAQAALAPDLEALKNACGIASLGAGKIPFICMDLAGGANIAGSNVLVGKQGGQLDFLTAAGYSKMGLPGDRLPMRTSVGGVITDTNIDTSLGLAFHSDSAFLRGINTVLSDTAKANINGAVIAARSENDTNANPHNPMYGINKAGANGSLLTLIGSQNTDSGGNSVAPPDMIDVAKRPTKVDRPSDVVGLVDVGDLTSVLTQEDAVAVMESMYRLSAKKMGRVDTKISTDEIVKDLVKCGYIKSADMAQRFGNKSQIDPAQDPAIVGADGVFDQTLFDSDGEFRKTAAVMKLVVNGFAGAGTIAMGGFDYHTGDRATGERRDFRAGVCMGAILEYAHKLRTPVMLYVFSDGSVFSNGAADNSTDGRGKGQWTGDNQATAASFFLVYNPNGRPSLSTEAGKTAPQHQQIGWYSADGDANVQSSPAANNVNLLVNTVILNYLALHDQVDEFGSVISNHGLGSATALDGLVAFQPICNGVITSPV